MEAVRIYYQRHDGETGQMRLRFEKELGVGELFKSNPKAFKRYTHLLIQSVYHFLIHPSIPHQTDVENKIEVEYPSNYFDDDGSKKN